MWSAIGMAATAAAQNGGSYASQEAEANSGKIKNIFDHSGWTVATSGSSASASRSESTEGSELMKYIVLGIVAIAVIGWVKKK